MNNGRKAIVLTIMRATLMLICLSASVRSQVEMQEDETTDPDCLIALDAIASPAPRFEDYATKSIWAKKPAWVDLASDPDAPRFRTVLSNGAKLGPNFASSYTIVAWGCGTSCLDLMVVDARSGKVYSTPDITAISTIYVADSTGHTAGMNDEFTGLRFRRDSSLLVVLGAAGANERGNGAAFYYWTGLNFSLLKFIPRSQACR